MTFGLMAALRMALAKHEVPKQPNSVAFAPGYGRINMWNGSIDFELSVGRTILGTTKSATAWPRKPPTYAASAST